MKVICFAISLIFSSSFLHAQNDPEKKLAEMGITLPEVSQPIANYVKFVRSGNLLFLAGHGPMNPLDDTNTGKVGLDLTIEQGKASFVDYIFEPSKEYIVQELIPRSLKLQFYKAILDSHASEHGARMTAMHKATDNATELLKELSLQFNKARQASITNEILEIVSGAEALKG